MSEIYKETYRGRDLEDIIKNWEADKDIIYAKHEADMATISRRLALLEDTMRRESAARAVVDPIPDSGYVSKHMSTDKSTDPYEYPHVEEVHWSRPQVEALVSKMSELYCKYGNGMFVDSFVSVFEYLIIHNCAQSILNKGLISVRTPEIEDMNKYIMDNFLGPCREACMEKGVLVGMSKEKR